MGPTCFTSRGRFGGVLKKASDTVTVVIPAEMEDRLEKHMYQSGIEQAAFLYVTRGTMRRVEVREIELLGPDDFVSQHEFYLELTDEARARGLKRAHDLRLALSEVHCHPSQERAAFSPSDIAGLEKWVPHVWWRQRGGPYVALVYGADAIDGLAWTVDQETIQEVEQLEIGAKSKTVTGLSYARYPDWYRAERSLKESHG